MAMLRTFCCNHFLVFLLRFIVYVLSITFMAVSSITISWNVTSGSSTWSGVTFNWSYVPPFPPMNSSYNNYTVLLDQHSHTRYSDGQLTPEQNIEWHIANGYNAAIVTDHNTIEGGLIAQQIARDKYPDKIKVLVGEEYTCCRIHMNLVFPPNVNFSVNSTAWPTDEELQTAINLTHSVGGFVTVNHIPWSSFRLFDIPTIQELFEWGVDYVEVVNQGTFDYQSYRFAIENGMGIITGTDMHHPDSGVYGWTTLLANFTEESIFQALKNKQTSIIYNAIPSPYAAEPKSTTANYALDPFFRFGALAAGYYDYEAPIWSFNGEYCGKTKLVILWTEMGILLGWLIGGFIIFETLRQLLTYGFNKCCCKKRKAKKGLSEFWSSPDDRSPLLELNINDKMRE